MYSFFKKKSIAWRGLTRHLFLVGLALFFVSGNLLAADMKVCLGRSHHWFCSGGLQSILRFEQRQLRLFR